MTETEVSSAGVNRSPKAYINNPQSERNRFREDIDRTLTQLRFVNSANQPMGGKFNVCISPVNFLTR